MTSNAKDPKGPDTIVLIHGLWLTALSWENWVERLRGRGYKVIARSWPGMEGDIDQLRLDPSAIAGLGVTEITDYYDRIVRELDQPPIIIGHSFGGLITQILLDRGLGAAGVAIDPAPVKGILVLPFSELRAAFPGLKNPFATHEAVALTLKQFHYGFVNHLTLEEAEPIYNRYAVPGPNHVLFQASFANFNPRAATAVDFHNDNRAPLLLIAGGNDHTVPAAVTRANYTLYAESLAFTDLKEYPDRTHWTIAQDGWEGVADFAVDWAAQNANAWAAQYASMPTLVDSPRALSPRSDPEPGSGVDAAQTKRDRPRVMHGDHRDSRLPARIAGGGREPSRVAVARV